MVLGVREEAQREEASSRSPAAEGAGEQRLAAAWQGGRAGLGQPQKLLNWVESAFLTAPLGVREHQGQICIFKSVMLIH